MRCVCRFRRQAILGAIFIVHWQCIRSRILGLTSAYKEKVQEIKIKEFAQLCMALAFIPKSEVVVQFNECVSILTEEHRQLLERFIVYFRDMWADCLFPIKLWNKYDQDFLHRTNNRVESWHSTLKQKLLTPPNVFLLVTALNTMENNATDLDKGRCQRISTKKT